MNVSANLSINILVQQVQENAFRVVLISISVFLVVCIFYIFVSNLGGVWSMANINPSDPSKKRIYIYMAFLHRTQF